MTHNPPPPKLTLLPETAPFTPEQRAWLDGFFVAALGLNDSGITPLSPQDSAALLNGTVAPADEDDGAPWHDQTMPLPERLKLAEGRPLRRRMMAAMGQQDCGQCGYNCQDYADAIFFKKEAKLNLCIPGGKDTLRTLKSLHGEMGVVAAAPAPAQAPAAEPAAAVAKPAAVAPTTARPPETEPVKHTFATRASPISRLVSACERCRYWNTPRGTPALANASR